MKRIILTNEEFQSLTHILNIAVLPNIPIAVTHDISNVVNKVFSAEDFEEKPKEEVKKCNCKCERKAYKLYDCEICGKKFTSEDEYLEHYENKHNNVQVAE